MRLIDADALFEVIEKSMAENPHEEKTQRAMHIHEHKYFLTLLTSFPTIQPVATDTNVGDTISRQAAIDALDFEIVHMTAYCDGKNEGNPLAQYNKGLEDGKKAIEALPSAQPKIIRCKDCVHYHTDVFGGELGLSGIWKNIIAAHDACDKWTKDMNCVTPDGFCFLAERRTDE